MHTKVTEPTTNRVERLSCGMLSSASTSAAVGEMNNSTMLNLTTILVEAPYIASHRTKVLPTLDHTG